MSELGFNILALKYAGISLKNERQSILTLLLRGVLMLSFVIIYVLACVKYATDKFSIINRSMFVVMFTGMLQTLFRVFFFEAKKKRIINLLKMFEEPFRSGWKGFAAMENEMRAQSSRHCRRFSSIILAYNWSSISITVMLLMIIRILLAAFSCSKKTVDPSECDTRFIYEIWWTSDIHKVPTYYFVNLWQIAASGIFIAVDSSTDAFVCSLMLAASERASLLSRAAPQALLPGPNGELTAAFTTWVKYHNHYVRILDIINIEFGPFIFFVHFDSVLNIITYSFYGIDQFFRTGGGSNANVAIFSLIGILVHIFVYATAGQQIIQKGVLLQRSVVAVAERSSEGQPFLSNLQIVVNRVSGGHVTSDQVTGMGFFTLSMRTFNTVLSSAFSYLVVLLRLKQAHGHHDV